MFFHLPLENRRTIGRAAKVCPSSFNPEPAATAYLRGAVAAGSG
jgi:hypothetical protein